METVIPFTGFYWTDHEEMINYQLAELSECCKQEDQELDVDFKQVYTDYAKLYTGNLSSLLGDALGFNVPLEFKELVSPREYNFTTDRIFADIDPDLLPALLDKADKDKLDALIAEDFTSRSGFISHYPNSLQEWGPVEEWDHNQVGTLLEHLLLEHCDRSDLDPWNLMESDRCNGVLSDLVWNALDADSQRIVQEANDELD